MFDIALKACIPIIGVTTDDPSNFELVIRFMAKVKTAAKYTKTTKSMGLGPYVYWTDDEELITVETYEKFKAGEHSLVIPNYKGDSPLVFDAGTLPTPEELVRAMLDKYAGKEWVDKLYPAVRGLSLRVIREVLLITQARTGNISPAEIRRTRASLFGATHGLYLENTSYDFYVWPKQLKEWLELNKAYFLKPTHAKLVPRGLLFDGPPGVGKSMASKVIANEFEVPLYRFDIASALDKYIGVAENRVAKILATVDREAPCVLLLDEVEKIFQGKEDSGVISRLLSLLLWWLAERQSKVFVVMTTNNMSIIPPELYRKGRVDRVFKLTRLNYDEVISFAKLAFENVVGTKISALQLGEILTEVEAYRKTVAADRFDFMAHADVEELVYSLIKRHGWA